MKYSKTRQDARKSLAKYLLKYKLSEFTTTCNNCEYLRKGNCSHRSSRFLIRYSYRKMGFRVCQYWQLYKDGHERDNYLVMSNLEFEKRQMKK